MMDKVDLDKVEKELNELYAGIATTSEHWLSTIKHHTKLLLDMYYPGSKVDVRGISMRGSEMEVNVVITKPIDKVEIKFKIE